MSAEIRRLRVLRKRDVIPHQAGPENAVEARRIQAVFGGKIHAFGLGRPIGPVMSWPRVAVLVCTCVPASSAVVAGSGNFVVLSTAGTTAW